MGVAGTRPGGRGTFLLRGKKVPKETRPAAPALRAPLPPEHRTGRPLNSLRSDRAAGLPRSGTPPLGGTEGNPVDRDSRMMNFVVTQLERLQFREDFKAPQGSASLSANGSSRPTPAGRAVRGSTVRIRVEQSPNRPLTDGITGRSSHPIHQSDAYPSAQPADSNSACATTVFTASSCKSGG
jgi:hypothetical protein